MQIECETRESVGIGYAYVAHCGHKLLLGRSDIGAALQKALDDGVELTDDCAAVERLGMKVALTAGDERNIKLTTPTDLLVGEVLSEEVPVL